MAKVEADSAVKIHFTVKAGDGTTIDSSVDRSPMELTLGKGDFFPTVEEAMVGASAGESRDVTLTPEQAFGPHHAELVMEVDKESLPDDITPEIGMQLGADTPDGKTVTLTVTSIEDAKVTLDANHPMAGQTLHVDVEIVEVIAK